jgi:pre-mRNA-processing factor 40
VYPLIKDDERYQNMLGQSGSTPLDLFWDMVEEMERDIRLKRNTVQDVMEVYHSSTALLFFPRH